MKRENHFLLITGRLGDLIRKYSTTWQAEFFPEGEGKESAGRAKKRRRGGESITLLLGVASSN